jgi:hypothetical protein
VSALVTVTGIIAFHGIDVKIIPRFTERVAVDLGSRNPP